MESRQRGSQSRLQLPVEQHSSRTSSPCALQFGRSIRQPNSTALRWLRVLADARPGRAGRCRGGAWRSRRSASSADAPLSARPRDVASSVADPTSPFASLRTNGTTTASDSQRCRSSAVPIRLFRRARGPRTRVALLDDDRLGIIRSDDAEVPGLSLPDLEARLVERVRHVEEGAYETALGVGADRVDPSPVQ